MGADEIVIVSFPPQALTTTSSPTFAGLTVGSGGIVMSAAAAGAERGIIRFLGKISTNLNAVAATNIFATPASGFTRCVVTHVIIDNFSLAATTVSISYGASATPT